MQASGFSIDTGVVTAYCSRRASGKTKAKQGAADQEPALNGFQGGDAMKRLWFVCLVGFFLLPASGQEAMPNDFEHWTAASLKQTGQELSSEAAKNAQHVALRRLGDFP